MIERNAFYQYIKVKNVVQCWHLIPALNAIAPDITHGNNCHPVFWAWMRKQVPDHTTERQLRGSLTCLAYFLLTCYPWICVQPGTGRRPVEWCRNRMSILYVKLGETRTVQTFNSGTSRPDVCQCLVVQIPMDNMSKKTSTSITHVACESKLRSVVLWSQSFIRAQETGCKRACGRVLCPGCPCI